MQSTPALGSSLPLCFSGEDGLVHVQTSASRKALKRVECWHALADSTIKRTCLTLSSLSDSFLSTDTV